jgi:hypothetical protein
VVVEAVQAVLLIGLAVAAFGWHPGPGWDPLVVVVAVALGTGAFSALGLLLAGTLRAEATMALTNALFLLALLLGGLLVPAHQLPGVLGALASLVPSAALADSLRIGLGTSTGDAVGPLLLLGAWAAGATFLTARTFRWEEPEGRVVAGRPGPAGSGCCGALWRATRPRPRAATGAAFLRRMHRQTGTRAGRRRGERAASGPDRFPLAATSPERGDP